MFQYGLQSFLDVFCVLNLEKLYFVCLCWGQVPGKKPVKSKHDSIFAFVDISVGRDFYPNTSKKDSCFKDNSFLLKVLFLHVHFFSFVLCRQKKRNEPKKRKPAPVKRAFIIQKRKFQVTRTCKFSFLHLKISNPFHIRAPPRTPFIIILQAFPHFIRSAPHGIRLLDYRRSQGFVFHFEILF